MTTPANATPVAPTREEAAVSRYAEVVVDARTGKPGGAFTYAVPSHMRVQPGHLVLVPFGKRMLHGIVTGLLETPDVDYTRPIASLVEAQPLLSTERIQLASWLARYYRAPLFEALMPMLPPGLRGGARAHVQAVDHPPQGAEERLSQGARRLLSYLRANPRPHRIAALVATLGPWVRNAGRALVEAGLATEWLSEPRHKPHIQKKTWLSPEVPVGTLRTLADEQQRAPRRAVLLRGLADSHGGLMAVDARKGYGAAAVTRIIEMGVASLQLPPLPADAAPYAPLLPTPEQQRALAALKRAMDSPASAPRTWLLHGATGSGKTEVYLQAIAHCLAEGRRAIALVPEVALTPQMTQRFEERFPGRVGLLHSRLTPARLREEWWRIFSGERGVVIGPRSALFAPVDDLGLIVLDEEHEWTYKQSDAQPHYHARAVAERLAGLTGAVVVLGSATPDVVTAWRAEQGAVGKLAMPARIERSGAPTALAEVEVVDMRTELREGNRSIFSRLLQERLQDTLAAGRQTVLFLNRRGAASVVACRSCGSVMRCARCSTPLTHHRAPGSDGRLRCHHCGRARTEPRRCPRCRSAHIRYLGLGTQRVVEEVGRIAPGARVLRWDSDTASGRGAHERLLRTFADGRADVLVGTQMVAKGLDVPSVDLVGVVLADIGIHMPDFRAAERTFQLLTQVAGRAGRGPDPGYAVVQTYLPEHYAVQTAAGQDYAAFYAAEMEHRRAQGNPPFSRLVRLLYDGHSDRQTAFNEAQQLAWSLRRTARKWDMRGVDVIGPAPTYPPRIRNAWRWHLLIRAAEPRLLLDKVTVPPSWRVDVDPVNVV
ncbi:MAG: primosomal protein N' [Chloroflexi bacterium]|nr:primosomal protein N' [Chloroflexota bacterium]